MPNSEELQKTYGRGWPKTEEHARATAEAFLNQAMENLSDMVAKKKAVNSYTMVREFMETFGHPVLDEPTLIEDKAWEDMRVGLIEEELQELKDAVEARDIVAIADALGDLEYVINGMALGTGIDLPEVVKEIHRSNMTKLGPDGKPIYREDGKILKGEGYEQPDLRRVLGL